MRRETIFVPKDDDFDLRSEAGSDDEDEIPMEMDLTRAGPPSSDDDNASDLNRPLDRQDKIIKYAKMILPHVGLVVLLVVYLMIGAVVFRHLEFPHELKTKNYELSTIFGLRDNFHARIWNMSEEQTLTREILENLGRDYYERLVIEMFSAYRNQYINERHLLNRTRGEEILWTYANSIFFATTVITTIGYGNLVPATQVGRLTCICFALFGIPLLLVTIADIGKFLSEFLTYLYKTYRAFKRKVRKQSRRISRNVREHSVNLSQASGSSTPAKAGSINLNEIDSESNSSEGDELRIPVVMVLFVLVAYTAIGGFLFRHFEGWAYFDAFYFCFITMATVGFGDIVPTEQVYMFFTMAYIIFGLSLATMCIDLAGTEYIRKIHYLGTKMEGAKGAVMTGLHAGEHLLKHTGVQVIRTAGGKLVQVRGAVLNARQAQELGVDYILTDMHYQEKNVLYEPLSPAVQRLAKSSNISIMPDDITEKDGYIVQNKSYDKPTHKHGQSRHPNVIQRLLRPAKNLHEITVLLPYVLKESNI